MFITRFTRVDGKAEDYYYHNREDAQRHLEHFLNDDSELYRNVAVIDDTDVRVLSVIPFENGIPQPMLSEGTWVKYRENFCTEGERKYRFTITNLNENTGRAIIRCMNSTMTIKPTEMVDFEMIQAVPESDINMQEKAS